MSHFVTVVLTDPNADQEKEVERLLAPFDEQIEVTPYEKDCHCVGMKAQFSARNCAEAAAMSATKKTIEHFRDEYWAMAKEDRPEWEDFVAPYESVYDEVREKSLREHPDYDKPDPDCEECKGTGKVMSTYNPKSKWDYWRIGGRWDGWIQEVKRSSEKGYNYSDGHEQVRNNAVSAEVFLQFVKADPAKNTPFALVTADEWHEKAEMGWWAITTGDKDEDTWADEVVALLEANPNTIAVACDLHI